MPPLGTVEEEVEVEGGGKDANVEGPAEGPLGAGRREKRAEGPLEVEEGVAEGGAGTCVWGGRGASLSAHV